MMPPITTAWPNPDIPANHIQRRAEAMNFQLLVMLRWFAIVGVAVAVGFTHVLLHVALPIWQFAGLLGILLGVNLISIWVQRRPDAPLGRATLASLLTDVATLTALLYLSGGGQNPFTGLFILLAIVAAFLLPAVQAAALFVATVCAQFWLMSHGLPMDLPMQHGHGEAAAFDIHLQGMFLSFFFSGALAVLFITGIKDNLRQRDLRLARLAHQIEEEQIVLRLGLLASTAAHDISTPLTNLAVLLEDWQDFGPPKAHEQQRQIGLMRESVAICREKISHMLALGRQNRLDQASAVEPMTFLQGLVADWATRFPEMQVSLRDLRGQPSMIIADVLLNTALGNLLDNAREAGARQICLTLRRDEGFVVVEMADDGQGFAPEVLAGKIDAKPNHGGAHGLGLILVGSALRRMGGRLRLGNGQAGGALLHIWLPEVSRTA